MGDVLNWGELVKEAGDSGKTFEALPDGDYELRVLEAPVKAVSNGTKTSFNVKYEVVSGQHARRLIWDSLIISPDSPAALGFFFRKMDALGLGADYFQQNPSVDQISAALKGRTIRATVGSRVWQGVKKNEIKAYHKAPASAVPGQFATPPAAAPAPAPAAVAPAPVAPAPNYSAPAAPPPAPAAPGFDAPPAPPF